ncbi:MAG: T9SS type A sorting domain-containing protein [Spirosomataceae bacterium]
MALFRFVFLAFGSFFFSISYAFATPDPTLTGDPAEKNSGISKLSPPPPDTYVWSGAVSKQWQDPANWLVNNAVATGIPTYGSTIGNVVQIPVVISGNYPEITTSAGARSITIASTASLTIKSGGQIRISGTADDGVTNAGTFTNNGTVTLDSLFTDGFVNQAGASLVNTATLTINSGLGSRLKNSGNINNSGTFNVNGGVGRGFFNYAGGVVINTNIFEVQFGTIGGIYNQGKIDNSGQMLVKFGETETLFDNLDTLINRTGATFTVGGSKKRLFDNRKYILNEGTFMVSGSEFEGLLNRQGAKLLNKSTASFQVNATKKTNFINAGYVENENLFTVTGSGDTAVYNKPTGEIRNIGNWTSQNVTFIPWVNLGKLTLGSAAKLNLSSSNSGCLKNDGFILSTTGCQISISGFNGGGILNESNGIFENNCVTAIQNINVYSIYNKGRYTQLNGSISSVGTTHFLKNENYFNFNATITDLRNTGTVFENTDTLILGNQVSFYIKQVAALFANSGYLYSDAQFTLQSVGQVLNNNGGKVVLGPQSILKGYQIGNVAVNSGHFTNEGVIQFTNSGPYIVNNTGTFFNKNRIKSARTQYNVYNNGGTFENSGVIEADTVGNAGVMQLGMGSSFTNTATGKIMVDMSSTGGISNADGMFINSGEILLAQTDSLRNSAINNAATFQNNNLIRIGRSGDNGIINTGTFTNAVNGSIFITATTKTAALTPAKGIDNQGGDFVNQACATIESNTKIVTSGGSFNNAGTIRKTEDNVNGDSNISNNTGLIDNLDANLFTVTGSNTPLTVSITSSADPICQGTTRVLTGTPAGGTFSATGPGSVTGNVLTATGAGEITITYYPTPGCPVNATQTITAKPTPSSQLTASQTDVCPNTEVSLDAGCSIPTASVNWSPGAPTVTPDAAITPYVYRASCTSDGCTGNESTVEVRTHRILVDIKDLGTGALPKAIIGVIKDNLAPTNLITAPLTPRRWTILARGCSTSESAVFKLIGPVNFNTIDNNPPYAIFANVGSDYFSIDHPNYGSGGSFVNGTYTLTADLRSLDGVGGPFPKNRVGVGALLATRTLQFTLENAMPVRVGSEGLNQMSESVSWAELTPNPVQSSMRLKVSGQKGQPVEATLLDAAGRRMLQRSFVPASEQHQEEFEVSHLGTGMYFLQVNSGNKNASLKLIKAE